MGAFWPLRYTGLNWKLLKILLIFGDLAKFTNLVMTFIVISGFEKALVILKMVRRSPEAVPLAFSSSFARPQLLATNERKG